MYQIYQILPNENIEDIAKKVNTTVGNIVNINGLTYPINLIPGNYIIVPTMNDELFQTYIVKKGDNLYSIAKNYGTDVTTLELLNGLKQDEYIYPNQELLIPSGNVNIYVTEENDTLNDVSDKSGVSIEEIINENEQLYLLPNQIIIYKRSKNE